LTPNAQAALRNLMETFSKTTRFILTCNYVEKIIDPIQSRCQVFGITPPSKKDVAIRVNTILQNEGVTAKPEDLVSIINAGYPDIRRILNSCQRQVVNGELKIDKQSLIEANYMDKVIELLSVKADKKQLFTSIRQLLAEFASTIGFRQWKLIILDEADYLTPNAQAALRNLMETF